MMKIIKEKINGFIVLKIDGRIDTTNFSLLDEEINLLFNEGEQNFIFNFSDLNYISSSGLKIFLIAQKKIIALKGKLYLCELNPGIREIFDISGFSSLIKIYDSVSQAFEAE
jgi:anti-anti-sigma factor